MLTRIVADTAALLDILSGYEPGDATWALPPDLPFREAARVPPTGLRVGLLLRPPIPVDPWWPRSSKSLGVLGDAHRQEPSRSLI